MRESERQDQQTHPDQTDGLHEREDLMQDVVSHSLLSARGLHQLVEDLVELLADCGLFRQGAPEEVVAPPLARRADIGLRGRADRGEEVLQGALLVGCAESLFAKGAVEIIFRNERGNPEAIAERTKEYEDRFLNPFIAASRGYIDDVIRPHSTRWRVTRALRMLKNKQVKEIWKKHDNIPL